MSNFGLSISSEFLFLLPSFSNNCKFNSSKYFFIVSVKVFGFSLNNWYIATNTDIIKL